jgi:hypothetical protein
MFFISLLLCFSCRWRKRFTNPQIPLILFTMKKIIDSISKPRYILVKTDSVTGQRFKKWCRSQGISQNRAICLLIAGTASGNYKLRQSIEEGG